jgi:MFS family permease
MTSIGVNMEEKNRNKNIKLFPIYKMISWDLLFFYAIIFLYLVQVKQLLAPQVLLAEALYNVAIILFLIPSGKIVDKIGKKNSVIIANISMAVSIVIILLMSNFYHLLIAYFVMAFGYSIKTIAENIILYDSIPSGSKRGKIFSLIDGKASSYYYYIDAVTSIATGFLFVLNPNIPIVLCLVMCVISTILACGFKHTATMNKVNNNEKITFKEAFKHVKNSKRLLYLILFYAIFSGLLYNLSSLRSSIFKDLNLNAQYFGIIYAVLQIISGTTARHQNKIHNKFKNETLAVLGIPLTISCILIGLLGNLKTDNFIFSVIMILFIIQNVLKGPYRTLIVRYMNNFTNKSIRTKLATIESLAYYAITVVFSLTSSWLLQRTSTANTFVVIGIVATFALGLLLYFMKGRVGLKPEQYPDVDLKYSHFNKENNENIVNELTKK